MNMPGFTAEASFYKTGENYRFATSRDYQWDGGEEVKLQACATGTLAACTLWLQTCYGLCWWSGLFGTGACIGCMTTCLTAHFAHPACTTCLGPTLCVETM